MADNLRNRIADVISHALDTWEPLGGTTEDIFVAQAIIDDLGLTVSGDGCGYHEIYGSYDTRFGGWEAND